MAVVKTSQEIAEINKQTAIRFMKDVRQSLLFKYDWADLLSAAPISLSLIGSCYVASSSTEVAINLKDALPQGLEFVYLRYDYLKPCLMQVADTGTTVFILAEKNMGLIADSCSPINELVNDVIESIEHLPASADELNNNLEFLKTSSDQCLVHAKQVEAGFTKWLDIVMELNQVTLARSDQSIDMAEKNKEMLAMNQARLKGQEAAEAAAKEEADLMKQQMLDRDEEFKEAAKNVPGVWEGLAFTLVEGLSKTVTTGLSQAVTRMSDPLSMVKGFIGGGGTGETGGKGLDVQTEQKPPQEPRDPAYAAAEVVATYLSTLNTLLTSGEASGVNWKEMADNGDKGLSFIQGSLTSKLESVRFTQASPSTILKGCINDGLEVIKELRAAIKEGKSLASEKVSAATIRKWQDKVLESKTNVLALKVAAASLPGNATTSSSSMGTPPKNTGDATSSNALASAAENKKIAQKAYEDSQKNYRESNKQLLDVQIALGNIRGELAKLNQQNATLEQIKKILSDCMNLLASLKGEITKLVRFFGAISNMVDLVIKSHVSKFIMQAESAEKIMLGGVSLADYQKKNIYTSCLMVRCYFMLVGEVASVYTDVSINYIMEGVKMCNELSKIASGDEKERASKLRAKNKALNDYTDKVENEVKTRVMEKQNKISKQLEARTTSIAKETHNLDALPSKEQQALEQALQKGSQAVVKYQLEESQSTTSMTKYVKKSSFSGGFEDDD